MAKRIKFGKKITAIVIIGLVFLAITGFHLLGVFQFLEYKSYDMRVRFWADTSYSRVSDDIIVILLDDPSLEWAERERNWGWPWPRQAYAEIVDYLNLSGAKSVAFDIIFSEPSVYRNARQDEIIDSAVRMMEEAEADTTPSDRSARQARADSARTDSPRSDGERSAASLARRNAIEALRSLSAREDDASFIDASNDYGKVIQAVMFSSQSGKTTNWPRGLSSPFFKLENFDNLLPTYSVGEEEKGLFPIMGLSESAGALGSVTGIPDSDGIIRRLRPFTLFDGNAVPGLSAASLIVSGKNPLITFNDKTSVIEWEEISIPVNKNGKALLRYRGLLDRYSPIMAMFVLASAEAYAKGEEPVFAPEFFKDAHVFVGVYGQGFFDIFSTPISSVYPGVGCHITMLDNMLQNDFIRESSRSADLLILLAVIIIIVFLTMFSHRISLSVGGVTIIIAAIIIGAFAAYQFGGLWIPMITYFAGALASFVTVTLYNYATEGSQKRFIKSAFSQYLSPKVVDQLILDPSKLKLGGEKRELTAVFTDIRAFSTFSEALGDPAKLVELLNFYLTKMSDIILDNEGTIDKYIGDAIVGFFGAPVQMKNHAVLACRSAVMMKKAELELNKEAIEKGLVNDKVMEALLAKGKIKSLNDPCPVYTRLGINSGDMVAGNMGTPNKMNYTIMGNAVNLAARLEGVNDQYDTGGILISEYTKESLIANGADSEFIMRPLSRVRVVGINTPLRLYELLDIASEAPNELIAMVKDWEKAFNLYENKDFAGAQDIFTAIYNKNNSDNTAKKYINRCANYLTKQPDEKTWDNGVDNLTQK
ncbi:MAG: adenylate/guanylate cyclase domain-containing protein [Treponema sp.]|nr:adenylate/guanylate cyclase domain-containing protein [Treponema sp.]